MNDNKALNALRAVLLITKHLDRLTTFLLALRKTPVEELSRLSLVMSLAAIIAVDQELVCDWFEALQLLTEEDISGKSVSDLLELAVHLLGPDNEQLGDVWRTAFSIGLLNEELMSRWVVFEGVLVYGSGSIGTDR